MQVPVDVVDGDLEAHAVVAAQFLGVGPFVVEGARLAEHLAGVNLAGVDQHEADLVTEAGVQGAQHRAGLSRHSS